MQHKNRNILFLIIGVISGWMLAEATKDKPFETLKTRISRLKEKFKASI